MKAVRHRFLMPLKHRLIQTHSRTSTTNVQRLGIVSKEIRNVLWVCAGAGGGAAARKEVASPPQGPPVGRLQALFCHDGCQADNWPLLPDEIQKPPKTAAWDGEAEGRVLALTSAPPKDKGFRGGFILETIA
eukprot:CAMPEP_0174375726 /NCGR_PEP_ID=MMETSP0811_2-20130205/115643_1 /TAXON_ID=73025 ORGANISM="Eutreptiella gymnastica-like, Strain CCMP1594" /NCGR_SAMPLE_ID=MMETSP0811_2 /ASSEMBLY_ACC=CAM_ASM_000667 /LENGTH=131 /DNA_ID=CAMNT_0015526259 /DNA_START=1063 /DNA_END=1459 /DNA_ORIENTATION=+